MHFDFSSITSQTLEQSNGNRFYPTRYSIIEGRSLGYLTIIKREGFWQFA